jgi:hypothetical protein
MEAEGAREFCRDGFQEAHEEMLQEFYSKQIECTIAYVACAFPSIGGSVTLSSPVPLSDDEKETLASIGCDAFISTYSVLGASFCESSLEEEASGMSPAEEACEAYYTSSHPELEMGNVDCYVGNLGGPARLLQDTNYRLSVEALVDEGDLPIEAFMEESQTMGTFSDAFGVAMIQNGLGADMQVMMQLVALETPATSNDDTREDARANVVVIAGVAAGVAVGAFVAVGLFIAHKKKQLGAHDSSADAIASSGKRASRFSTENPGTKSDGIEMPSI